MTARNRIYWACQVIGWGIFVIGNLVTSFLADALVFETYIASAALLVIGVLISHTFRNLANRLEWTKMSVLPLIPRVLLSTLAMGLLFTMLFGAISDLFLAHTEKILVLRGGGIFIDIMNFSVLFFIWNLIYFAFHIFDNFRAAQIKNLELKAAKTEIELSSFKNQMNPHFMFNSLNSIRALVDENPSRAKEAITKLSGLLRSSLSLGKKQLVPLRDELDLVENYLSMEKIRYEERLVVKYAIPEALLDFSIPPFMLQTIVENAVKHGISKLKNGGTITLRASDQAGILRVEVQNSGNLAFAKLSDGIGINNTRNRLQLLYDDKARFTLNAIDGDSVLAVLDIPQLKDHLDESIDN